MTVPEERYFVAAYWRLRWESAEACAARLAPLLREIGELDPLLSKWYERAGSAMGPASPALDASDSAVAADLRKRRDADEDDTLGYTFAAWNGMTRPRNVTLGAICGSCNTAVPWNNVRLDLPTPAQENETLFEPQLLQAVVRILAHRFEPEWAGVVNRAHVRMLGAKTVRVNGWMRYIPSTTLRADAVNRLPGRVSEVPGRGWIVCLPIEDRFTVGRADHVRAAKMLDSALAAEGVPADSEG